MKNKHLILGAAGQLGKEFVNYCTKHNIDYLAPDEQAGDITNTEAMQALISQYKPTYVINCAAYNAVDNAEEDKETALLVNAIAPGQLANVCEKNQIKLVHFSSDYVFDGEKQDLYNEQDEPQPLNVYGLSKWQGEQRVQQNDNHLIFRLSWVIGPGQQNFIYKLRQWASNNKVLKISSDEASVPTFTFDIVEITMKSLGANLSGTFHLTNSNYSSRFELARAFIEISGMNNVIVPVAMSSFVTKAARPLFSAMSNEKLATTLKYEIPTWQESLKKYVKEYL